MFLKYLVTFQAIWSHVKEIHSWTQCERVRGGGLRLSGSPPPRQRRAFPEISRVEPIFQLKRGESF